MTAVRRWAATAVSLLVIAATGWADYETGPDIGFSLFYLAPIAIGSWWFGRGPGLLIALGAATSWFFADLAWREEGLAAITHWNAFTRLVIYLSIAFLVAHFREDRDRLASLNDRLHAALGAESTLARTDLLTSLGNSRRFLEHLAEEVMRRRKDSEPVCVAFIDIDNFKRVNDRHGHVAGDDLLRRIALDIGAAIRQSDLAARMGGDEFAILFRNVSPAEATAVATRLIEQVRQAGAEYTDADVGASVGIAWFTSSPDDPEELLRAADAAMYEAKAAGKGQVRLVFDNGEAQDSESAALQS